MNDYEAEKCILIAEAAMKERDFEKAKKFLQKSIKIQDSNKAQALFEQCTKLQGESRPRANASEEKPSKRKLSREEKKEDQGPSFSAEDSKICEDILKKENYYEILGAEKNASEEEIKKKYKRLALKLHPDKNHSPQATEAFKKVSQAFACLTDKNKRKIYDEHGTEQNFRRDYQEYFHDEESFDPEDIFEMFFSGRVNPNRRRRNYTRHGNTYYFTNNGGQQQQEGTRFGQLLRFLPLLLILVLALTFQMKGSIFGNNWGYSNVYSFDQSYHHRIRRETENGNVVYFASQSIDKMQESEIQAMEKEVEQEYTSVALNKCNYAKRLRTYIDDRLRSHWIDEAQKSQLQRERRNINYGPCKEYERMMKILS